MIELPFKILSRKDFDSIMDHIHMLEGHISDLEFELEKYKRPRDEKGRFIGDRESLVRMLKESE